MEQIYLNNIRVQLLSGDIVHIERKSRGKFCDTSTFFIPDKEQYRGTQVTYTREENVICFGEYELYLPETGNSLTGLRLDKNGKKVYAYKKLANSGELPALNKTPDVFAVSDTPRITVPAGGYSKDRKGEYKVEENVQDVYLLLCQGDPKKLRKLYAELTGKPELVRLSTLGGWNSKYYAYNEETAKQLILDYESRGVPLDVMVIDTDWRSCENGWGYDVNEKLFPDMKRFLDFAHEHGVEVMFNDHPEPVDGKQVFAPEEIEYREKNLQSIMEKGLDIWWYDRNWATKLVSPTGGINPETLGLYLFTDVTRHFWQKKAGNKEIYRRPVIMGNLDNVANGCYAKIYSSASHRYSIQWTGDIESDPGALAQEVATMLRAGNNVIPYCNADCGGHLGNPNKEGFIRWMQFGALSPVFRPHCTNTVKRFREPWAYDEETLDIVREYNNLRYRLLPVIYKNAYESYECGAPIFRSLGWNYPNDRKAARLTDEYMLGDDILIKPIAGRALAAVPSANFTKPVRATYYDGTELKGEPIASAEYSQLDIILNHTSPEKGVPVYNFSARFETEVKFSCDVELAVRCDDGSTVYIDGEKVFEDKTLHSAMNFPLKVIEGGKPHRVEIEYFQAGGEAAIGLFYCETVTDRKIGVYLPEGKWLDVFSGRVHTGGKVISKEYGLRETPLFVRLGALIPLAYDAKNTKEQSWDRLVYDFYPCKDARDSGYLYEDDTETTAYKLGEYRRSEYSAHYSESENAFIIKLHAANGNFRGKKCCEKRAITVKYHLLKGVDGVKRITVNGVDCGFMKTPVDVDSFPLGAAETASDGGVICTKIRAETDKEYEIKFYL